VVETTYDAHDTTPVLVCGEPAAVLNIESMRIDAFTETDVKILEIIAQHVASALERINRVEEIKKSNAPSKHST
jgi:GAF domain-containing protein